MDLATYSSSASRGALAPWGCQTLLWESSSRDLESETVHTHTHTRTSIFVLMCPPHSQVFCPPSFPITDSPLAPFCVHISRFPERQLQVLRVYDQSPSNGTLILWARCFTHCDGTIQYGAPHTAQPFPIPYSKLVGNDSPVSPAFFSTTKNHESSCQYYAVAYGPIRRGFVCVCPRHRRRERWREGWRQR